VTYAFNPQAPDRDAQPQYALPLVLRLERADPPTRTDALEAAARAVLLLLTDDRAQTEWRDTVEAWERGRIRKVVRRARGAEWRRAEALAGVTLTHRSAQVRVFPPVPVEDWPRDLARLQVSGTELEDPVPPAAAPDHVPVLWLNPQLQMSAGKAMAQAGHGVQLAWWELTGEQRREWTERGFDLVVRAPTPARWDELVDSERPMVRDAGFTEIAPGSCTVVADVADRLAAQGPA
jgi:peptidyl-tRNA hydrolase